MTVIKALARLMIEEIRKAHHFLTHNSRKRALARLEKILNDVNASDDEIIFAAIQQRDWVNAHGYFGIRGRAGSGFLNHIDQFIHQGLYLLEQQNDQTQTPIKKLAHLTLADIKKKQNQKTDASRKKAVSYLTVEFNKLNITDREIIAAAELQKEAIEKHGRFGLWGKTGSTFLDKINCFINQARFLVATFAKKNEEERQTTADIYSPFFFYELRRASRLIQQRSKRYVPSLFELKNARHDLMEERIKCLLEAHFGKMSRISRAWRYRMDQTVQGLISPNNTSFFEQFAQELQTELPSNLKDYLQTYQELIQDHNYISEKEKKFSSHYIETQKEIYEILHNKFIKESAENANHSNQISRLFSQPCYSIWRASEEAKIDAALLEKERQTNGLKA